MLFKKRSDKKAKTTRLQLQRIPVDALRKGMHVINLDRPWTEVPVVFQHLIIESDRHLSTLRHYCQWVEIEIEESVWDEDTGLRKAAGPKIYKALPERRSIEKELPRAKAYFYQAKNYITHVLSDIEKGNDFSLEEARPIIQHCVTSILSNANAMFWLNRIKHQDAYTAEHCLRVAIMSIAFGRFLGLPRDDLEVIGLCGLLHDIGKMKVPNEILNKPGSLDADELVVMRKHSEYGFSMLQSHHQLEPIIADVALSHHERMDGRGYPNNIPEWRISRFTRLVTLVDTYDAITSDRCYRKGSPPSAALSTIYRGRGTQFDSDLAELFIRMIGVYPPGSLVQMTNGEVGIVLATNPNQKLKPRVELLFNAEGCPRFNSIINLADDPLDDAEAPYQIKQALPDGAMGFSLQDRIEQQLKVASASLR